MAEEDSEEPTAEFVPPDAIFADPDDDSRFAEPGEEWNPSDNLDLSYKKLIEALGMVRRSVADTASTRKVVEFQLQQLQERSEGLAADLSSVRSAIDEQISDLKAQLGQIEMRFEHLVSISAQLQTDVERFRTEKELLKASYSAVEALTMMGEVASLTPTPDSSQRTA